MKRKIFTGAMASLALGLAMSATSISAFAAGQGHGIAGKITKVSSTSVQVQTTSGSVTEQLASTTRVIKVTRGSLSDLTPGTFARVTLATGSNTVTDIHIESRGAGRTQTGTHPARPSTGSGAGTTTKPRTGLHRGGQIVNAANGQLTMRNAQGQTTTYKLAANVSVTKTVPGHLTDLVVGETVRIIVRTGSTTALAVIIESA